MLIEKKTFSFGFDTEASQVLVTMENGSKTKGPKNVPEMPQKFVVFVSVWLDSLTDWCRPPAPCGVSLLHSRQCSPRGWWSGGADYQKRLNVTPGDKTVCREPQHTCCHKAALLVLTDENRICKREWCGWVSIPQLYRLHRYPSVLCGSQHQPFTAKVSAALCPTACLLTACTGSYREGAFESKIVRRFFLYPSWLRMIDWPSVTKKNGHKNWR